MSFCSLLRAPSSLSFIDLLHTSLMPAAVEASLQPLMQNAYALLFSDELRRQHQQVGVPMLTRQLRYLLVPCQRRPYSREPVGCIRHAQSCTACEHSALHLPAADSLRHGFRIVRIVVRRVESFWPNIDRLIAELLELVHETVLQFEPHVIRADENALRQSSVSPWQSPQSAAPPGGQQLC